MEEEEEMGLFARVNSQKPIPFVWKTIEEIKRDLPKSKPLEPPVWRLVVTESELEFFAKKKGITVDELWNELNPPPTGRSNYTPPKKKRK